MRDNLGLKDTSPLAKEVLSRFENPRRSHTQDTAMLCVPTEAPRFQFAIPSCSPVETITD
jgi:hypothetical protein